MKTLELTEEQELAVTRRLYEGLCRKQRRLAKRYGNDGITAVMCFLPAMVRYAEMAGVEDPLNSVGTAICNWLLEDGEPEFANTIGGERIGFVIDGAMILQRMLTRQGECLDCGSNPCNCDE